MSRKIRCANPKCRRLFLPDPRVKNQQYCSKKECQRFRKRHWQHQKITHDPDYQANQRDAHHCWKEQNRGYWRRYREQHPEYVKRNRLLQMERDRIRRRRDLAKMDASKDISSIKPSAYYLVPAKRDLAKMDTLLPKYLLIPKPYQLLAKKDSMDWVSFYDLDCTKKEASAHDGKNHSLPRPSP